MKSLTRRSVTTGGAIAAATALPFLGRSVGVAESSPRTEDLVRAFARRLLTEREGPLTAGEWIERKRIAVVLQVMIRDEPEPWEPWELELVDPA
jgi:hypothetical protein